MTFPIHTGVKTVSYNTDDQGLIQAAAETATTFREVVQMWEHESSASAIAAGNAVAFERSYDKAKGHDVDLDSAKAGFDRMAAKCKRHDALATILKAIITYRWPAGAADLFS